MRRRGTFCLLFVSACAGVSPDPAAADASQLAVRELSADEQRRIAAAVQQSMEGVLLRRFDDAASAAAQALAIDPRCARARAVLGMCLLHHAVESDPPDLAASNAGEFQIRLAQQLAPTDTFVGWMTAVFLAESGHMSAAAEAAEHALAVAVDAPPAERADLLRIAGTYRYELGEERAALPHLQAYTLLRPDDSAAHFRLGSSLLRIAAVPRAAPSDLEGAELLTAQRSAESAAAAFARCAERAPGDEDAALSIATAWWRAAELAKQRHDAAAQKAHTDAAEQSLRTAAERFPASPEPWFRLGVIAEARGADDVARTMYTRAIEREPRHVASLLDLAALLDRGGDAAAANNVLRQVLALDDAVPCLTPRERKRLRERTGARS